MEENTQQNNVEEEKVEVIQPETQNVEEEKVETTQPETQNVEEAQAEVIATVPKQKQNLALAIAMAAVGALIGCLLWGLLYTLNVIAGIATFLSVFLAGFFYKKYYGKIDLKGYIIISALCILELALTMFVTLGISIISEIGGTLIQGIKIVFELMRTNPEVKAAVITDLLTSLLFLAIGIGYYVVSERKKLRDKQ